MRLFIILLALGMFSSCSSSKNISRKTINIVTSDIDNFWKAFDLLSAENDSLKKREIFQMQFIDKGTPGLKALMEAKNYSIDDYLNAIKNYPKFWNSVRENTLKSKSLSEDLEKGIMQLRLLYPELKPATIYFSVGAMRSGGTTLSDKVLIGSELAMVSSNTNRSEFQGQMRNWADGYFNTNPIENIVLLNIHEYVHTQQSQIPDEILYQCLYEGVAEFVSVKAMNVESSTPALEFGRKTPRVREKFEEEMFLNRTYDWLWSNSENEFNTRDLGYYIGYSICEKYYNNATDKKAAIKKMIELDFAYLDSVKDFIDESGFFSATIDELKLEFEEGK